MAARAPSSFSSLKYRWVASAGIGVADGAAVTSWTDGVGSVAITEATSPPTFRASVVNFNGKPGVEFNGSGNKLAGTITNANQPTTWYFVLDDISGTGNAEILQTSEEVGYFNTGIAIYGGSANATGDARVTGLRMVIGVWNGASSTIYWKDAGVSGALKSANASIGTFGTGTSLNLAHHSSSAWPDFNGRYADFGHFTAAFTSQDAQDLYDWLNQEYGQSWATTGRPAHHFPFGKNPARFRDQTPFNLRGDRTPAVGQVSLAGTTGIVFGGSGTLSQAQALAGTTGITFGGSGTLSQTNALAGSTGITFGMSGDITVTVPAPTVLPAVTYTFDAALAGQGIIIGSANVMVGSTNTTQATLQVTDGSVAMDRTATERRRASITVVDPTGTITPTSATAMLSPLSGNEIRLTRGLRYPDNTTESYSMGVFRILDAEINVDKSHTEIVLTLVDRSDAVERAKLLDTYVIASGTNYSTAIQTLIATQVSGLTYNFTTTTLTTPLIVLDVGADPWAEAMNMAQAMGCELFFDAGGVCTLAPVPDINTAPTAATYTANGTNVMLLGINRKLTRENMANVIVVSGESSALITPVRSVVKDTDPTSPTYYLGTFGQVPYFITSPLVTTTAQALTMATAELSNRKGLIETVQFNAIVDPRRIPGDVVSITESRSGINAKYMLERIDMPMISGPMVAQTRARNAA